MTEYTIELQTIHGIADSDFVDRLAEIVYELEDVVDPLIGLNGDGSIEVSFAVIGENAREAALRGLDAFTDAITAAQPLRAPTLEEVKHGQRVEEEVIEGFAVRPSADRETVFA